MIRSKEFFSYFALHLSALEQGGHGVLEPQNAKITFMSITR